MLFFSSSKAGSIISESGAAADVSMNYYYYCRRQTNTDRHAKRRRGLMRTEEDPMHTAYRELAVLRTSSGEQVSIIIAIGIMHGRNA